MRLRIRQAVFFSTLLARVQLLRYKERCEQKQNRRFAKNFKTLGETILTQLTARVQLCLLLLL
ncbi:hypothetical protein ACVRWB_08050 [Streptococcus troglodytae]|uniref:Uncharacterized protein n=1 Tax=Streptococcus troglodytae TaxID=1111760 RepID=A0A1L7LL28_9STRE|nr:uncharacterized protein SRT_16530 [Streptococcus troglodytae]